MITKNSSILISGASIAGYGVRMPAGKVVIQAIMDPADLNKDYAIDYGLLGDAGLTLTALVEAVKERLGGKARGLSERVAQAIRANKDGWLAEWMPRLTSDEIPLSTCRVIWDLLHTVDVATTIITHDAGSPRDQLSPFWQTREPLTYIGWGKTTQLGYSLGLAMGAKLVHPDKLCSTASGDWSKDKMT